MDGLRVVADSVPDRVIRMPSSPGSCLGNGLGNHRSKGNYWAAYELLFCKYDADANGVPIIHMAYEFVAIRAMGRAWLSDRFAGRLLRMVRLRWFKPWTGRLRKWLAEM